MRHLALVLLLPLASACTPDATDAPAAPGETTGAGVATGAAADSVEVRLVRDDATGAELPRITLPGRPAVEARVNAALDSLSASMTCGDLDDDRPADAPPSEFETDARVAYAADDVLSVAVHSSYFCGTAYPTAGANQSVTFDLTTGAAVPFDALFRADADRAALAGLFSAALTPMAGDTDGDCDEALSAEALADATFGYALTDAGITVQPEFAHVIAVCGVEATLPYASVRAFARDGGVLARVADAQAGG